MSEVKNTVISSYSVIVLFPAKSINETSDKISVEYQAFQSRTITHSRPRLSGIIEFYEKIGKQRNLFRVFRFGYYNKNSKQLIPLHPDLAKQFFSGTGYVLIDNNLPQTFDNSFETFMKDFSIDSTIAMVDRCPSCAEKNQTTILLEKSRYRVFGNHYVCIDCALSEVRRELRSRHIRVDSNIDTYLLKILKESRSVEAVLSIFSGEQRVGDYTLIKKEIPGDKFEAESISVNDTPYLLKSMKKMIKMRNIHIFTPIQTLSLKSGLLAGSNQLIVSATSSGKTLIGEMASLTKILRENKKALICVPLVALANTKYEELSKSYAESIPKIKMGLRVGKTRLKVGKSHYFKNTGLKDKNLIIGTYEGIDKILRSGINLSDIGCIVIDEIQTLGEEERGPILDGLIARLRVLSKKAQVIGLSATIGNPNDFAKELNMDLVHYRGQRPTPLEKHVLLALDEYNKHQLIKQLITDEQIEFRRTKSISQTIVFTNSRRKTTEIANFLQSNRIKAEAYHSGIPYHRRKRIETQFTNGSLEAVVATYALGAGVDFPASTVIFESVLMGIDILSANNYNQMAGRAGRLGKHKRGRAIFVALPTPPNARIARSEFEIAVALSSAALEEILPNYNEDDSGEQVLATVSFLGDNAELNKVKEIYNTQLGNKINFNQVISSLDKMKLISLNKNFVTATKLGKATSVSFLKPSESMRIVKLLRRQIPPLYIISRMLPFENVFHSKKVQGWLERALNRAHVSNRFFNGPILDLIRGDSIDVTLDKNIEELVIRWSMKIFNCGCKDSPFCNHGIEKLSRGLLNLRLRSEYSPKDISEFVQREYGLFIYAGDLLRWMETVLHLLEGVGRIATVIGEKTNTWTLVKQIENPKKNYEMLSEKDEEEE